MTWHEQLNQEFSCEHTHVIPVRFTKSNGVVCVRLQCQQCGDNRGERKKADYCVNQLSEWNEALRQSWRVQVDNRREELRSEYIAALLEASRPSEENEKEWWQKYNAYLHSQQWHKMRQRVLDRDGNLCQACLANPATHVHHLSYELYNKLGKSAAFELVAICRPCHEQIHPHMSEAQDELTLHNPFLNGGTHVKYR